MRTRPTTQLRAAGWLIACACLLQSGCREENASTESGPAATSLAGTTVVLSVPREFGVLQAWSLLLDEWAAQTGGEYRVIEYDLPADDRPNFEDMGFQGDEAASLVLFPLPWAAELAATSRLQPLPTHAQQMPGLDWLDLFVGAREHLATFGKQPLVVPISAPTLVCYFRRDLLERAGLVPPVTWGDYQQLVKKLDQWAPGLTAVEPWGTEYRATTFLSRAVPFAKHPGNFSLYFDYRKGDPLIASPGFVRGLDLSRELLPYMPEDILSYSPADCRREFLAGRAAIGLCFQWLADSTTSDDRTEPRDEAVELGFSRLPGSRQVFNRATEQWETPPRQDVNFVPLSGFGGYCGGVSSAASPETADAAWNLLSWICRERLEAFPPGTASPCRESHLSATTFPSGESLTDREKSDYLQAVAANLRDTNLVAELPVSERSRYRQALTEAIEAALLGEITSAAALQGVAEQWEQIADNHGREQLLASYRLSLGLAK